MSPKAMSRKMFVLRNVFVLRKMFVLLNVFVLRNVLVLRNIRPVVRVPLAFGTASSIVTPAMVIVPVVVVLVIAVLPVLAIPVFMIALAPAPAVVVPMLMIPIAPASAVMVFPVVARAIEPRHVFCRSNEVHGPITGVVFKAVPAPVPGVSRGHVQIERRWRRRLGFDQHRPRIHEGRGLGIAELNLTVYTGRYFTR
jgi:hypothetical protein